MYLWQTRFAEKYHKEDAAMSEKQKNYLLGTEQKQEWMRKGFFAPRGLGFLEPGIVSLDSAELSAFNVVKSFYQNYPEVFNMAYISEKTGLKVDDIKKRFSRMYHEHLIMFVKNSAVSTYGFGLYWWEVKLKEGTSPEFKKKLASWYQEKDEICTGYETEGEFDFFNGNHMRTLDNLLYGVMGPWRDLPEIEYVHICPTRRDLRDNNVNQFDAPGDGYRKFIWSKEQKDAFLKHQNKIDASDFAIIDAINNTPSIGDMFDFDVLAKLSGLDAAQMKKDIIEIIDHRRIVVPMIYLNFMKVGLTQQLFLVRLFQNVPCYRKAQIVDELQEIPEFNSVAEFTDAYYDIYLQAYTEISDLDALRKKLESYAEVEDIKMATAPRLFRRWVARLDDENGYWEECVFTDDINQDRASAQCVKCRFSGSEEVK